jgi:enterochelin esterase family protein
MVGEFKRPGGMTAEERHISTMKIIITFFFCSVLVFTQQVAAQQKLVPNDNVIRTIEAGKSDSFSLPLNDGDYVTASLEQNARVDTTVALPDGSLLRRYEGASGSAKNSFSFAAEGGGLYSIKITNPGQRAAKYELRLEKILSLESRLVPDLWKDPNTSPRLQALKSQIASGQKNTDSFWKEVAAVGTPLIDPFPSDDRYHLVTFLWRSTYETKNVLFLSAIWGVGAPAAYAMHQIPDSDVWYLTLKLPRGARFSYQLSPNDPMTSDGPRDAQRAATRQADPLNLHPLSKCPPDVTKDRCRSMVELPPATESWFVKKPGIPEGRVEKQRITSNIQKLERPFSVYTPANYKADGPPNALLIMFDGENLPGDTFRWLTTLDNLIAASKIPPTVAVFVENLPRRRLVDLIANPEFADFLAAELVPWVRAHYNVSKKPAQTVVGGNSAGGLAAPYVALRHPKVFGNSMSVSGAFWWSPEHHRGICGAHCPDSGGLKSDDFTDATTEGNFLVKQFLASPKLPLRFYLTAGTFEIDRFGEGGGGILEMTRHLRDVLLAKGYEVHYQQFHGGHDGLPWRSAFADGLIALLGSQKDTKK